MKQRGGQDPSAQGGGDRVRLILAHLLQERSLAAMVAALKALERPQRSRNLERAIKQLLEELSDHLKADQQREALATALAAMFADADYAISLLTFPMAIAIPTT